MTEYWQSQARKFCEFCKCWFADNKVSISFHENGKKHKENLKKHISQLGKKSSKEFKQKEKMDNDIKKMEKAAMAAYLKDVKNNADLTSQSINEQLEKAGASSADLTVEVSTTAKLKPVWQEAKSESGTYYWNTVTNETIRDAPDQFVSIAEQEKLKKKQAQGPAKKLEQEQAKESTNLARKQIKKKAVKKETPVPTFGPTSFGPEPRAANPFGKWKTVVSEPVRTIDLQLPKVDREQPAPPVVVQPEIKIEFKEKQIQSLDDVDEPTEFKKRKLNVQRKNMRKRLDDD